VKARKQEISEELQRRDRQRAMSIDEFCLCYGVGRTTAYDEIKSKRLRARKCGKRKIELKLTPENLLPGGEVSLADAVAEGDAERIAELTGTRDRMRGLLPDQLVTVNFVSKPKLPDGIGTLNIVPPGSADCQSGNADGATQ
jgi:hypothetical protein